MNVALVSRHEDQSHFGSARHRAGAGTTVFVHHALGEELRREEEREESVLKRIAAMRGVPKKGTAEWEQLFRKLMEEEYLRDGLDT